jgi:hypothetical protein
MYDFLAGFVPALLGVLWLVAMFSDPLAPCGMQAKAPAATIADHLRAIANHVREIAVLVAYRTGAGGQPR